LPGQADGGLQSSQRRAQLVRDVVQQSPLGADQDLQLLRHAIEITPQIRNLVASSAHPRSDPDVEPALRQGDESGAKVADGCGKVPGQQGTESEAGQQTRQDGHQWRRRRALR
jgi:hypothetical protein